MSRLSELKADHAKLIQEVEDLNDEYNRIRLLKDNQSYLRVSAIIQLMREKNRQLDRLAKQIDAEEKSQAANSQAKLF